MANKALLVGINDYAPVGPGGPDLRGCVNDVTDVAKTLAAIGIVPLVPAQMRILTDKNATRSNIINGLKWLITGAKKNETLVFYYSGHGSYVVDLSSDEPDHRDETICPHDYATAGMIKDDDLRAVITALPAGVNLEVVLDSCNSGTATRVLFGLEALDALLAPEETVRFIEPPIDESIFGELLPARPLLRSANGNGDRSPLLVGGLNHVLWSAAKDTELAKELPISGAIRGVFTYHFCRLLRAAGAPLIQRKMLDNLVTSAVIGTVSAQTPQLEGAAAIFAEKVFK